MSQPWQGRCDLRFLTNSRTNQDSTAINTLHQGKCKAPLKMMKAFSNKDGRCELPILHSAGGLVGGDQLSINIHGGINTSALVSTVAAQKVYGSVGRSLLFPEGKWSKQKCSFHLEKNSDLEWIPQELIMYKGGLYEQNMIVSLSSTSSFLCVDIVRLGRTAAGETLENGSWRSSLEIKRQLANKLHLEFIDRLELSGDSLSSIHGMNNQPVFGSLIWIMPEFISKESLPDFLKKCREERSGLHGSMACSQLKNGISARYIGSSTKDARFWFYRIWKQSRILRKLSPPGYLRIWPMQEVPV